MVLAWCMDRHKLCLNRYFMFHILTQKIKRKMRSTDPRDVRVFVCMWSSNILSDNLVFANPGNDISLHLSIYISLLLQTAGERGEKKTRRVFYDIAAKIVFNLWYIARQLFILLARETYLKYVYDKKRLVSADKMEHFSKKELAINETGERNNG